MNWRSKPGSLSPRAARAGREPERGVPNGLLSPPAWPKPLLRGEGPTSPPCGRKGQSCAAQPGGLPDISRRLRSAATIPPVTGPTNLPHPGGVPEIRGREAARDWKTVLAPLRGAVRLRRRSGGVTGAQPPANVLQPSGLARSARLQVERHALQGAHRAEGLGDEGELEGRRISHPVRPIVTAPAIPGSLQAFVPI